MLSIPQPTRSMQLASKCWEYGVKPLWELSLKSIMFSVFGYFHLYDKPMYPASHPTQTIQELTVVDRLGPCQQPVPCSYFMMLNLLSSGPIHEPHVLEKKQGKTEHLEQLQTLSYAGLQWEMTEPSPSPPETVFFRAGKSSRAVSVTPSLYQLRSCHGSWLSSPGKKTELQFLKTLHHTYWTVPSHFSAKISLS